MTMIMRYLDGLDRAVEKWMELRRRQTSSDDENSWRCSVMMTLMAKAAEMANPNALDPRQEEDFFAQLARDVYRDVHSADLIRERLR